MGKRPRVDSKICRAGDVTLFDAFWVRCDLFSFASQLDAKKICQLKNSNPVSEELTQRGPQEKRGKRMSCSAGF